MITETQGCIDTLSTSLSKLSTITTSATSECESLINRSRHLNSLTSPASDASALLTQAQQNLVSTLSVLKEARSKFDTVTEYDAIIRKIFKGARDVLEYYNSMDSRAKTEVNDPESSVSFHLTETDVFQAVDAMEAIKSAHNYFSKRTAWKSSPNALAGLERLHQLGVDALCRLLSAHLTVCGHAVRPKPSVKKNVHAHETSIVTRKRFALALSNRDVLKRVGEFEEFLPLDSRAVRELRLVMECLKGDRCKLGVNVTYDKSSLKSLLISSNKVIRTEKCGSGSYTNLTKQPLKT